MKGVYVIDLVNACSFVVYGASYEDACNIVQCTIESKLEGSYHFYPLLEGEHHLDAERRVYMSMRGVMPGVTLLTTRETMDVISKSTFPPGIKRIMSSDSHVTSSPKSDALFNLSL